MPGCSFQTPFFSAESKFCRCASLPLALDNSPQTICLSSLWQHRVLGFAGTAKVFSFFGFYRLGNTWHTPLPTPLYHASANAHPATHLLWQTASSNHNLTTISVGMKHLSPAYMAPRTPLRPSALKAAACDTVPLPIFPGWVHDARGPNN